MWGKKRRFFKTCDRNCNEFSSILEIFKRVSEKKQVSKKLKQQIVLFQNEIFDFNTGRLTVKKMKPILFWWLVWEND